MYIYTKKSVRGFGVSRGRAARIWQTSQAFLLLFNKSCYFVEAKRSFSLFNLSKLLFRRGETLIFKFRPLQPVFHA